LADTIDFTGVPEEIRKGGGSYYAPPGDYPVKVLTAEKRWKNDDHSNPAYYRWEFQILDGEHKGTKLTMTTSLAPQALFNLRNLIFAAIGKNVAGKKVNFSPDILYGKKIAVTVEDREYTQDNKQKIAANVVDVRPIEELEEEAATEEEEVISSAASEAMEGDTELEDVDLDEL
jgi:Protein of unknown function (DUF669)